jgi:CheY-like chemotaxis protein
MRNLKISLCYHPTTVVFIDDNVDYLNQMQKLFQRTLPCLTFSQPEKALEFLNAHQEKPFVERCVERSADNDHDYFSSEVTVRAIQKEMMSPNRFKEIAVVVVDYSMPGLDGIELCKKIKHPHILKLLLTGNADLDIAVEAFNQKIIDKFLKKGAPGTTESLMKDIKSLQARYFLNLSNTLMNQAKSNILTALENVEIAELFQQICAENQVEEYYLMSDMGDFLLLNRQGELSRFSIISEQEINELYRYASEDSAVSKESLLPLKNHEKTPLFETIEDIDDTAPEEWEQYYCPLQRVPGTSEFYFAYKKNLSAKALKQYSALTSLQDYLLPARS